MDAVFFLVTKERMCRVISENSNCKGCPLYDLNYSSCYDLVRKDPYKAVRLVNEWNRENIERNRD